MQQFEIDKNETIRAILRSFPNSSSNYYGGNMNESSNNLEGFYFYSDNTLYECRANQGAEEIFLKLVRKGLESEEAEPFGKTLSLDLFRLYEEIADKYFEKKYFGRALSLYFLSNVKTSKLVGKYSKIGRVDVVANHLMNSLRESSLLSNEEKKELSFTLFQFYLEKVYRGKIEENTLLDFLSENKDYDTGKAMMELIRNASIDYYFRVAHSRNLMPLAINTLINKGSLLLDNKDLLFLFSNQRMGYVEFIKSSGNSTLMKALPFEEQLELIIRDQAHLLNDTKALLLDCQLLPPLLPFLDLPKLEKLLNWIKPKALNSSLFSPLLSSLPNKPSNNFDNKINNTERSPSNSPSLNDKLLPIYNSPLLSAPNSSLLLIELLLHLLLKFILLNQFNFIPLSLLQTNLDHSTQLNNSPTASNQFPSPQKETSNEEIEIESTNTDSLTKTKEQTKKENRSKSSILSSLSTKIKAVKISTGWNHVGVISSDLQLYMWGSDSKGQLGIYFHLFFL